MTLAYDNGINLFDTAEVYAAGKYVSLLVGKRGVATGPPGAPFPVTLVPRGPACASPSAHFLSSKWLKGVSFSWALDTGHLLKLPCAHTPRPPQPSGAKAAMPGEGQMKLSPALPPCPRPPTLLTSSPPNGAARAAEAGLELAQELASPALQEALPSWQWTCYSIM